MKTYTLILKIILLAGLIISDNPVFSQGKFEISSGVGIPEMINLKIKYGKDIQIALSQGFFSSNNQFAGSTSLEIYYHLAGKSKFTDRPIWYVLGGVDCYYGINFNVNSSWYPYLRFGRTIDFSRRYGLNLDIGPVFLNKSDRDWLGTPVLPSGSISFFIRF